MIARTAPNRAKPALDYPPPGTSRHSATYTSFLELFPVKQPAQKSVPIGAFVLTAGQLIQAFVPHLTSASRASCGVHETHLALAPGGSLFLPQRYG